MLLKNTYALLFLLSSHFFCFSQCDSYSILLLEENKCLPDASFTLGFEAQAYQNFSWSQSTSLNNSALVYENDSSIIKLSNIGNTTLHEVYLDFVLPDSTICRDTLQIQAQAQSNAAPTSTNSSPASDSDSLNIDFSPAGDQCSIYSFRPKNFNNDPLQGNYTYEWELRGTNNSYSGSSKRNNPLFYLELEGNYDLYVKVFKPLSCGSAFVYKDSLMGNFVSIRGNLEIEKRLNYMCLEPTAEYPLGIDDFSPIADTSNATFSWNIYRKNYNLKGIGGYAYSATSGAIANRVKSTIDSVNYQFTEAGDYLVLYTINVPDDCSYTDQQTFNIGVQAQYIYPRVDEDSPEFSYFPELCSGKNSKIYFSFSNTSYLDVGSASEYHWTSTDQDVRIKTPKKKDTEIAFLDEGTYPLTLEVENDYGCVDRITREVVVKNADPTNFPIALISSVTEDESIKLKIGSMSVEDDYYFQLDRWDTYFDWQTDYERFDSLQFIDKNAVVSSDQYRYQVRYVDYCGNDAGISNLSTNILLEGQANSNQHQLSWNPYQEWADGVESYKVQLLNQSSNEFNSIATLAPSNSNMTYTNENLNSNGIESGFCYRIEAQLINSSETSHSNVKCFISDLQGEFPNAFTPNGDGINDLFKFEGEYVKSMKINIYSRWGKPVFSSDRIDFEWDGKDKDTGEACQQGVYIVNYEMVDFNNKKTTDFLNLLLLSN